jgi:hypothetical protein
MTYDFVKVSHAFILGKKNLFDVNKNYGHRNDVPFRRIMYSNMYICQLFSIRLKQIIAIPVCGLNFYVDLNFKPRFLVVMIIIW